MSHLISMKTAPKYWKNHYFGSTQFL